MSPRMIIAYVLGGALIASSFVLLDGLRSERSEREKLASSLSDAQESSAIVDEKDHTGERGSEKGFLAESVAEIPENKAEQSPFILYPPDIDYEASCTPIAFKVNSEYSIAQQVQQILENRLPERQTIERLLKQLDVQQKKGGTEEAEASLQLARLYWAGNGVMQDRTKARNLIDRAKPLIKGRAWYQEAELLAQAGNLNAALSAYRQALAEGHSGAAFVLARYYMNDTKHSPYQGAGDDMLNVAQNMLLERLARGDCRVLYTIGSHFMRKNISIYTPKAGVEWFQASARSGNVYALMKLGDMYAQGVVVSQDMPRALEYYRRAAEAWHLGAMHAYANLLLSGDGVEQDVPLAMQWLEKAGERYFVPAIEQLASVYHRKNTLLEYDPKKRAYWLEKWVQIDSRNAELLYEMSEIYRMGEGVEKDLERAFSYTQRAAKEGSVDAYVTLGDAYRYGLGVPAEAVRAYRFYRYAANKNHRDAMLALVDMYGCGKGRTASPELAQRWREMAFYAGAAKEIYAQSEALFFAMPSDAQKRVLRKMQLRAEEGDRYAVLWLSLMVEKGVGVAADKAKAKALRELALSDGKKQGKALMSLYQMADKGYVDLENYEMLSLLERAAALDVPAAFQKLGQVYLNGLYGEDVSVLKARDYFTQAAEEAYPGAERALAKMVRKELGDVQKMLQHLGRAALQGDAQAMVELAGYALDETMPNYNPEAAANYMQKAEHYARCNAEDMGALIAAYLDGYSGEEGRKNGIEMLHLRAEEGDADAAAMLAEYYLYGRGVSRDIYKAMRYYETAAEGGNVAAQAALARASLLGYGVEPSAEAARHYWQKAAHGGDSFSEFRAQFDPAETEWQ